MRKQNDGINKSDKDIDKHERYRRNHPKRVKENQDRYRATEKGAVNRWSLSAARRANKVTDADRQRQPRRTREEALAATEKYCPRCKVIKPMEEFGISKHAFDGHFPYCKPCSREIEHEKVQRDPKKYRRQSAERQAAYRERNPERAQENQDRYYETEKGQLRQWSASTSQRAQQTIGIRTDGRVKSRPGGDITAKQLRELWQQQNGKCALTSRVLLLRAGKQQLDSPSVDRIDSTKGYTLDNIRLITYQANCAKLFGTDAQLFDFCRDVLKHAKQTE